MTGETSAWRTLADEMFASFGDVIRDATVTIRNEGTRTYSSSTGKYSQTTSSVETKLAWLGGKGYNFVRDDMFEVTDRFAFLRGSDFVTASAFPKPGCDVVCDSVTYVIKQSQWDEAGTQAYIAVHMAAK